MGIFMKKDDKSVTVYSSESGRICPGCGQPAGKCSCIKQTALPKGDGTVRVSRSTKGRGGKCVSLITGLQLGTDELNKLAKHLKQKCGSGGTVKEGEIEIQGDHREQIVKELIILGYKAKLAGG
jgi:translation initiation factor 1